MGVSSGDEQCVGAGAEPLVSHRLLLAGHHDLTRPSRILIRLESKEEIIRTDIAGDVMMMMKEECRLPPITKE